jgi:hypothetical protein
VSANALKLALHFRISYQNLHASVKLATPDMFCNFKFALQIYKKINQKVPEQD